MVYHGPILLFMVEERNGYHGPVLWFMVEERNGLPWCCPPGKFFKKGLV
jgi:hypothetical protein